MRKFLLEHKRAPGDILVMSALVRDIALTYPNECTVSVHTSIKAIWDNNPYLVESDTSDTRTDIEHIKLNYGDSLNLVNNRNKHFLTAFHEDFEEKSGLHVPLRYPRPDYHLSDEEKHVPLVSGRYWVIISGGKTDFVTKHWNYKRYQQVANILKQGGIHCVQLGALGGNRELQHFHPRLENTLCLVGLTTVRDMARIIYHADGVICPVTAAMHLAAALQKPCVVVAGGREEWWWEAYAPGLGNFGTELFEDVKVPHRFLHTIGRLDCCQRRGCWRNKVESATEIACRYPLNVGGQILPKCMQMIEVNHVIEAIMSYYTDGSLPPIGKPKAIALVDGQLRVLGPNEQISEQPQSALAEALTMSEPKLLLKTSGQKLIPERSE